jgi:antitoxin (DNA-binding transcriptional repressor) of toxin-antitoxin stability system
MYHMKTVTVRDLRYDFPKVERILREGAEVRVTKRSRVIARLVPEPAPAASRPDFLGRMRALYGDVCLPTTGAEIVRHDRDRY